MPGQPIVSKMVHRAVIQRDGSSGVSAWNTPPAPTWKAHLTVKCFAWSKTGREMIDEDKTVVIEDIRAIMPLGTDVTEKDRILSITDRQSSAIFGGPLGIDAVQRHGSHLEVTLQKLTD